MPEVGFLRGICENGLAIDAHAFLVLVLYTTVVLDERPRRVNKLLPKAHLNPLATVQHDMVAQGIFKSIEELDKSFGWSHPDVLYVVRRLSYIIRVSMAIQFINLGRSACYEMLPNIHMVENRRVEVP
jgi:hypothetical protein